MSDSRYQSLARHILESNRDEALGYEVELDTREMAERVAVELEKLGCRVSRDPLKARLLVSDSK
ncbi:MAG TPA: hypothetical protein VK934_02780 [Fimbriimonas sp.]|nr:hypothetical protein [Fimbriimonas sp.]